MHNPNLPYNCTYATAYHVDHFIPGAGSGFDYSCGGRLYSGHNGTDYHTWPFPWHLYQSDQVIAVAAADGIILVKADGQSDENCTAPSASWNAVYLGHADGSRSWYGHLKRNSLISKNIGQSVSKGEMLGVIASSGSSTTPHLHFEVYDSSNNRIDPYFGNCNMLNSQSWWTNQKPEREPTLNLIATHDAIPEHGCPSINEDPHFSYVFYTGDSIVTAIYFHDEMAGDTSLLTIKAPNNTIWQSWTHVAPITSSKSWYYWSWNLPISGATGLWTFNIQYRNSLYTRTFYFSNGTSSTTNLNNKNKRLIKIVDMLGREIEQQYNIPIFFLYDDGSIEKRIISPY